jgi:hypothetical protein
MNFAGSTVGTSYTGAMVAFPPLTANQNSGYVAPGPANEGPSGRYRSPYIRNCTNFATNSIGLKVDGDLVNAAFTGTNNLGQDLKSMVVDSYTQYNENGIGVSITILSPTKVMLSWFLSLPSTLRLLSLLVVVDSVT